MLHRECDRRTAIAHDKPDLCVPSQSCENENAFTVNTGTSAACALATGVVAALRSKWHAGPEPQPSPDELKDLLIRTARKTHGPYWDGRFGHGILDAKARLRRGARAAGLTLGGTARDPAAATTFAMLLTRRG